MTDEPLPGMPTPPSKAQRWPKDGYRITRIQGRHLCSECCRLIHALGQSVAPYPRVARWRIHAPEWVKDVCESHKTEFEQ